MISCKECKILRFTNRLQLRKWLAKNCQTEKECFVTIKKGKPKNQQALWYIDCVEEALCFGWIDSIVQKSKEHGLFVRLSPRRKNSHWTMHNIERCKRLIKLKLMTKYGLKTLPKMNHPFKIRIDLKRILIAINNLQKILIISQNYTKGFVLIQFNAILKLIVRNTKKPSKISLKKRN